MNDPRDPALAPSLDDRIQVATVTHRARVAMAFATIVWALIAVAFWITSTPRRWIAALVAIAAGVGLYELLR